MPPLPGSPATQLDQIAENEPVDVDQRGSVRGTGSESIVDAGAVQSSGFILSAEGAKLQGTPAGTTFASPLQVTVTAADPLEPVAGGVVTFDASSENGATATFSPAQASISTTGVASTIATASSSTGRYTAYATLPDQSLNAPVQARFALNNTTDSLYVNTADDPSTPTAGVVSLREAIANAEADAEPLPDGFYFDQISFSPAAFPAGTLTTIQLTQGPLTIDSPYASISIEASKPGEVAITNSNGPAFEIESDAVETGLANLTITHCRGIQSGGAIESEGNLYLSDCTLSNNSVAGAGGAIDWDGDNAASLVALDDTFTNNTARSGGGIYDAAYGTLDISSSTFAGNSAAGSGGAIYLGPYTKLNTEDDTFARNTAAAGAGVDSDDASALIDGTIIALNTTPAGTEDDLGRDRREWQQ